MRKLKRLARAGATLLTACAVVAVTPGSAAATVVIRDDDGVRDNFVDVDLSDDQAVKRLVVPSGTLSGATSATLSVFAQADACGLSGSSQRLTLNGATVVDFNPCDTFSATTYTWGTFTIPLSSITDGATNSFEISEIAGDWTDRNAYYGVDSTNDYGRSDIYQNSSYFTGSIAGELMWYLTVVGGAPTPGITVSPTSIAFGSVLVGSSSSNSTVTVTSSGTASLSVTGVTASGLHASDFPLSSDTCTGATLSPGSSCTFQARFAPSATGSRSATVTITSNAGARTVSLSGTGTAPGISVSPSTVAFGNVVVGSSSSNSTVTVSSTGSANLTVSGVSIGGTNPGDFSKPTDSCTGATVSPGGTCTFTVRFTPTTTGARSATVTITSNAGTRTVSLSGTGTAAGITVSTTSLAFGNTQVGTTSASQTVTVTSSGTANLTISSVLFSGTNPGDFSKPTDSCTGASLAPGLSCTFTIRFAPTATGSRSAVVTINSNAGARTVSLSGTGTAPGITVSTTSLSFGSVPQGSSSTNQTVTVTSSGTANLTISSVSISGANAGDFSKQTDLCTGASLAPGASCTFQVRFTPTAAGPRSATVTISSNAGSRTVSLSGTGLDTVAPVSSFVTANGAVVIGGNPISGRTTDNYAGVANVVVTITPGLSALSPWTVTPTLNCNAGRTNCTWSLAAPTLPGPYVINARATDLAGNAENPGPSISIIVA